MNIIKPCNSWGQAACLTILLLLSAEALATEMVYAPVNPTFGGNPNNAPGLLANAQAQNPFKAPPASPLQNFNNSLQSAILSRLSSEALTSMFGKSSTLVPGSYDTGSYTINVVQPVANGPLTITTTDKTSGSTATFTVDTNALGQ